MTVRPVSVALGELGHRLRALREQAGHTGAEFAGLLGEGWSQPKISKIENGRQLPAVDDLRAWISMTGGDADPLVELRDRAAADYRSTKDRVRRAGGVLAAQADLTSLIESCTFVGEYLPALIPGRLQIGAYMRDLNGSNPFRFENGATAESLGQIIAAKLRRQAVLYEPGREFVHVVTEAALRLRYGTITPHTMRAQLHHLAELATLPGHTFGVVPFSVACPVVPSNFAMYDRDLVRIETAGGGTLELTDSDALTRYSRWLDQLVEAALTGPEAAEFCRRVAAEQPA